jgi:hypothetical protein
MSEKRCSGCKLMKPLTAFSAKTHKSGKVGYRSDCRVCKRAANEASLARAKLVPDLTAEARFWPKVQRTADGCWYWMGAKDRLGYGKFMYQGNRSEYAHRVVLMLRGDKLPDRWTTGLVVDHICRNRGCVRPDHLRIVTQHDNVNKYADRSKSTERMLATIAAKKEVARGA